MADADDLMAAPPGVPGPSSTIAASVEAAVSAGMANVMYLEQSTRVAGDDIGDLMPLTPAPDHDTSILQAGPGAD